MGVFACSGSEGVDIIKDSYLFVRNDGYWIIVLLVYPAVPCGFVRGIIHVEKA